MAGIYIHIPFCRQACAYCDFHFSTSLLHAGDMARAISRELDIRKEYLASRTLTSLYFGGGTPSVLEAAHLNTIMETVQRHWSFDPAAEVTLEANPEDITAANLAWWRTMGVNRLSIGLQSFSDAELRWMNRTHLGGAGEDAVKRAQDAGFGNISIDLIYGSRFQDRRSWIKTLERAIGLGVPHISSYHLTVEDKTRLGWLVRHGREPAPDDDKGRDLFLAMREMLCGAGFVHYEISNFAQPGREAVHNSSYWRQAHYLGAGPSAHSYDGVSRQWNLRSNPAYIRAVNAGGTFFEREVLAEKDHFNEYVMTRLRTLGGCDASEMDRLFSASAVKHFRTGAARWPGKIAENNGVYTLTTEGMLFADRIASDLFLA